MLINEQTKIAALIKHHPDALETIVTLSPDFKKLRNPLLRKLMAGRTSIAMASKIGGCRPEDFFQALAPLGFEADTKKSDIEEPAPPNLPMPDYIKSLNPDQIIHFDVRNMLAEGVDPLRAIQEKIKALKQGEALLIVNNFEPVPLIKLLEKQGFSAHVNYVKNDVIETYFYKENQQSNAELIEESGTSGDWEIILEKYKNQLIEIDVRHLEMPMPMMTILEALETISEDKALYVHHKRIPVFLLTELKDRGFQYRIKEIQEGEVYLLIFKNE
ncbi:MAG: DUF2249 domain-containing protein [Chitinophagales bacterium]|nr:DUF2249 domain-containing protein [Chitinophagales bacterium]MCZ2393198.1 DUF2249 domain-containing protein [Chitinophagales bacterium]